MIIRHLHHEEINRLQWDAVASSATVGLPYAMSWYLDVVSPGWEGLVSVSRENDYDVIFPLPVKPLCGIRRLVQPVLTQQLGLFSSRPLLEKEVKAFLQAIPYKSFVLQLNESNPIESLPFRTKRRTNLTILLDRTYETLFKSYSDNTRRNVRKSSDLLVSTITFEEFLPFCQRNNRYNIASPSLLVSLFEAAKSQGSSILLGVRHPLSSELLAVSFLLRTDHRLIYLLPASSPEGRRQSAMFRLVDEIIRLNCAQSLILDFEGSMIDGVSRFYRGFGAQEQIYYKVSRLHPEWLVQIYHRLKGERS